MVGDGSVGDEDDSVSLDPQPRCSSHAASLQPPYCLYVHHLFVMALWAMKMTANPWTISPGAASMQLPGTWQAISLSLKQCNPGSRLRRAQMDL